MSVLWVLLSGLQVPGRLEGAGQGRLLFVADHLNIRKKHSMKITVINESKINII